MKIYNILRNISKKVALDYVHPIGQIFISADANFDPNNTWGGSWVKITDRFLIGAGNTVTLGKLGGEASHTLTVEEMPSHNHVRGSYATSKEASGYALGSGTGFLNRVQVNGSATDTLTGNIGGGKAHNNLPPYLAVNMWQRTA